jgi:hypothetical protein
MNIDDCIKYPNLEGRFRFRICQIRIKKDYFGSEPAQEVLVLALSRSHNTVRLVYPAYFCRGSVDCLVQAVQKEGLLSLYKGFVPCWLRNIISLPL